MAKFKYTRSTHEQFAIEAIQGAKRELKWTHGCGSNAVYALVRANREIARARVHLASIGGDVGKRTGKLWGAVQRAENQVNQAGDRVARCLIKR